MPDYGHSTHLSPSDLQALLAGIVRDLRGIDERLAAIARTADHGTSCGLVRSIADGISCVRTDLLDDTFETLIELTDLDEACACARQTQVRSASRWIIRFVGAAR